MGFLKALLDFVMKLFGAKSEPAGLPAAANASASTAHAAAEVASEEEEEEPAAAFDTAGFDPGNDEDAFFEGVLYMESEGMISPTVTITEENRAETMSKYGLRDRSHWQTVKSSCYQVLIRKHGSMDTVMQREMNWRAGLTQRHMQNTAATKAASGELNPVDGISLEQWAAMNAAIVQGVNLDDMLKGAGIDKVRWDRARTEWEARMARDTTFTIAQIYGAAFQNASKGKYAELAKEANAARVANRELTMQPPMTLEQYWEILYEQAYGAKQGKDPVETLKGVNLTVVDWCDLSAFMGYHIQRTWGANHKQYTETMKKVESKYEAKYPGVKADVDISF
ncbi:MAG TPA: hypothetical protein VM925_35710 [Labilithrix sp.]|nr:hypothetical protein [Labilithrix sp.]